MAEKNQADKVNTVEAAVFPHLNDTVKLTRHMRKVLHDAAYQAAPDLDAFVDADSDSSVLFLLGLENGRELAPDRPCLILNKRSPLVKQPGDLCCPGGGVSMRWDHQLARLLMLPRTPLTRWPFWKSWKKHQPERAKDIALLFATGLREGFEEMRLNPLGIRFIGGLPSQRLNMFNRIIHPNVAWVCRQHRFRLNAEVEKVVYVPLQNLMNPALYARCRLNLNMNHKVDQDRQCYEFPCFVHRTEVGAELLWGATYRITMDFLQIVFGYRPPDTASLPVYNGELAANYMTGSRPVG